MKPNFVARLWAGQVRKRTIHAGRKTAVRIKRFSVLNSNEIDVLILRPVTVHV